MYVKKIFYSLCLFGVFLFLVYFLYMTTYNHEELSYLKTNHSVLTNNLESLEILKDNLTKKAFFIGENHGVSVNNEFKLTFIKYLHQNANVRFVLLELSFSSGYILNEFLKSGDLTLLDQVFSFYEGTPFYTKEEYTFFLNLYRYNQTLAEDDRLTLVGIDIEHSIESSNMLIEKLQNENQIELIDFIGENRSYRTIFYENFDFTFREEKLYDNYLFLQDYYKIDKFFAQFGSMHCFKALKSDGYQSLAYLLNIESSSVVKGEVVVIMTFYKNSERLETIKIDDEVVYHKQRFTNYSSDTLSYFKDSQILFNLHGEDSIYQKQLVWYDLCENDTMNNTTDYYDYILLINNAPSSTPIHGQAYGDEVFFKLLSNND